MIPTDAERQRWFATMATVDLVAHVSPADLGRRYRAARGAIERSHLQIIWLLSQGREGREVAAVSGYGLRWIGAIVQRYNRLNSRWLWGSVVRRPGARSSRHLARARARASVASRD